MVELTLPKLTVMANTLVAFHHRARKFGIAGHEAEDRSISRSLRAMYPELLRIGESGKVHSVHGRMSIEKFGYQYRIGRIAMQNYRQRKRGRQKSAVLLNPKQ